ncbi:MAG: hypothetical protein N4A44_03690 [Alphaproteobacteria bacterium]|jgi:hypothetical protein|nr:hypothetical protein [Alphaproteobacteria bacterium]
MEFYRVSSFDGLNSYKQAGFEKFSGGGIVAKILFAMFIVFISFLLFFFAMFFVTVNFFILILDLISKGFAKVKSFLGL